MTTLHTPPKRFNAPHFRIEATALIFFQDSTSSHPDARLRLEFYISHRDDQFSSGKSAATYTLSKLGLSDEHIKTFTVEVEADRYIAVDAKYVRNPHSEPVEAALRWAVAEKDLARMVRQRRLVPDDHHHMVSLYGPKQATTETAAT